MNERSQPEPRSEPGTPQLVVGHDGHAVSHAALNAAVDLAGRLGAHLHVVHSVTVEDYGIDPDTEEFEQTRDRNLAEERLGIARGLGESGVGWTYHEEHGDPAVQLARLADETDALYIVVGATHRGLMHLNGSVSKRLLHLQARPVLVIPDPATVSGLRQQSHAGHRHR